MASMTAPATVQYSTSSFACLDDFCTMLSRLCGPVSIVWDAVFPSDGDMLKVVTALRKSGVTSLSFEYVYSRHMYDAVNTLWLLYLPFLRSVRLPHEVSCTHASNYALSSSRHTFTSSNVKHFRIGSLYRTDISRLLKLPFHSLVVLSIQFSDEDNLSEHDAQRFASLPCLRILDIRSYWSDAVFRKALQCCGPGILLLRLSTYNSSYKISQHVDRDWVTRLLERAPLLSELWLNDSVDCPKYHCTYAHEKRINIIVNNYRDVSNPRFIPQDVCPACVGRDMIMDSDKDFLRGRTLHPCFVLDELQNVLEQGEYNAAELYEFLSRRDVAKAMRLHNSERLARTVRARILAPLVHDTRLQYLLSEYDFASDAAANSSGTDSAASTTVCVQFADGSCMSVPRTASSVLMDMTTCQATPEAIMMPDFVRPCDFDPDMLQNAPTMTPTAWPPQECARAAIAADFLNMQHRLRPIMTLLVSYSWDALACLRSSDTIRASTAAPVPTQMLDLAGLNDVDRKLMSAYLPSSPAHVSSANVFGMQM